MAAAGLWLGLIQGFSEFLPVSSSGHLMLARALLGVGTPGAVLEVWLHGATLLAVVVALRARLGGIVKGLVAGDGEAIRICLLVGVGTLPAALAGWLLHGAMDALFRPSVAAVGFLLTSLLLLTAPRSDRGARRLAQLRLWDALLVGAMQALALLPGLSRSASTMAAARWCGLTAEAAAELSFLLAIPVTAGALMITGLPARSVAGSVLLAALAAGTSGVLAVQWAMRGIGKPRWWTGFGVYTFLLAGLAWWIGR